MDGKNSDFRRYKRELYFEIKKEEQMRVSLITKEEIKELVNLIDYIEDEETRELIRKLHGSYNIIYTNYKEKIKEKKRVSQLEIECENKTRKINEQDKEIAKLQKSFGEEIEKNIETTKKQKEAEFRIEMLESKLREVGVTVWKF